jgi:hypothetical protein
MSGDAHELPGSAASSSTERGKARRFLLATPTFWLSMTLLLLDERVHIALPLDLTLSTLAVALMIGSLILQRSRPQGMGTGLTPRKLRRMARLAEVPEIGAMIVLYGSALVAVSILTLNTVALYHTP